MSNKKIIHKTSFDQHEAGLNRIEQRLSEQYGGKYTICRSTQPFTIYPEGNAFRIRKWVGAVYIDMFCDPDNNTIMYYVL
jgi:hypothetical protein